MFRCWFTSMYSDKKMNPFFLHFIRNIFCTFLTIVFRGSTQNGCFLHFFFHCTMYLEFIDIIL